MTYLFYNFDKSFSENISFDVYQNNLFIIFDNIFLKIY